MSMYSTSFTLLQQTLKPLTNKTPHLVTNFKPTFWVSHN